MEKNEKLVLCEPPDTNGARAYKEHDPFGDVLRYKNKRAVKYNDRVSVDGKGVWRVIDIHPESGDVGLDGGDGIWYVQRSRVALVQTQGEWGRDA